MKQSFIDLPFPAPLPMHIHRRRSRPPSAGFSYNASPSMDPADDGWFYAPIVRTHGGISTNQGGQDISCAYLVCLEVLLSKFDQLTM